MEPESVLQGLCADVFVRPKILSPWQPGADLSLKEYIARNETVPSPLQLLAISKTLKIKAKFIDS